MNWTVFKAALGPCYYVDPDSGNDTNIGTSAALALKSITKALLSVKAGSRIYLKKGSSFDLAEQIVWKPSSEDPQAQAGIFSYGIGKRPILNCQDINGISCPTSGHNIAFVGLDLRCTRTDKLKEPDGILINSKHSNILIEDCRIDGFSYNVAFILGNDPPSVPSTNLMVRGCTILNANGVADHSGQGIYTENVNGLTIEDNVFYNNGFGPNGVLTQYRHTLYLSHHGTTNVSVQRNIFVKSGCFAVQLRGSGIVANNLIIDSGIGIAVAGEKASVIGNMLYGFHDVSDAQSYGGINVNTCNGVVVGNLIWDPVGIANNSKQPAIEIFLREWTPKDVERNLTLTNNQIINWPTVPVQLDKDSWRSLTIDGLELHNPKRRLMIMRAKVGSLDLKNLNSDLPALGVDFAGSGIDAALAKFGTVPSLNPTPVSFDPVGWLNQSKDNWNPNFEALALMNTFRPPGTPAPVDLIPPVPVDPVPNPTALLTQIKLQAASALIQIQSAQLTDSSPVLKIVEQQVTVLQSLADKL